jgi:hypothetical protein
MSIAKNLLAVEGTNAVLRLYIALSGLRNEDEEMNRVVWFIVDKGSYPGDVVS